MKQLNFRQAKALLDKHPEAILLDVRDEAEYITGHPIDAELLPLDELDEFSAEDLIPSLDTPVLVYCRSGRRSYEAARKLESYGYTQVYDLGGLIGWPYGLV